MTIHFAKFEFHYEITRRKCEGKRGGRENGLRGGRVREELSGRGGRGKRSLRFKQVPQFLKPPGTVGEGEGVQFNTEDI